MSDIYELETIDGLPRRLLPKVPSLHERKNVRVGNFARLFVFVNGSDTIAPWVTVVEVTPTGYICEVGGVMNSPDWHPFGSRIPFTADNIIAL